MNGDYTTSVKVLYEDNCVVAFDKPPGLLVIPSPKHEKSTLISIVNRFFTTPAGPKLHPCHRLDRDTSGIILFAKGKANQQAIMAQFKQRRIQKKYIAFVQGRLKKPYGEWRSVINDNGHKRFRRAHTGKLAITRFKVVALKKSFSIVEVYPLTGRTNQIRIQFCQAGFPLVGERKYAFAKDFELKFRRTALHATEIQWLDPLFRKLVKVTSPLYKDMEEFLLHH